MQCAPVNAPNGTIKPKHLRLGPQLKFTSHRHYAVNTTFAGEEFIIVYLSMFDYNKTLFREIVKYDARLINSKC